MADTAAVDAAETLMKFLLDIGYFFLFSIII
jgi:hypothetical protein